MPTTEGYVCQIADDRLRRCVEIQPPLNKKARTASTLVRAFHNQGIREFVQFR
jgi:hypothetical protein